MDCEIRLDDPFAVRIALLQQQQQQQRRHLVIYFATCHWLQFIHHSHKTQIGNGTDEKIKKES